MSQSSKSEWLQRAQIAATVLVIVGYFAARSASPSGFFFGFVFSEQLYLAGPAVGVFVWGGLAALTITQDTENQSPLGFMAALGCGIFALICLRLLILRLLGL